MDWCSVFLKFKSHSRDETIIRETGNIFLKNIIKSNIPKDIQIQIVSDIPLAHHSKDVVMLYTATLFDSHSIYDMILKLNLNLVPVLKSCIDPELAKEMVNIFKGVRSCNTRFPLEQAKLFKRIRNFLVRFIGSDSLWKISQTDELKPFHDILFLKKTYLKEFGSLPIRYTENLLDVLYSHCIFEKMEDMVRYTIFAKELFDHSLNVGIQLRLLKQARFLYERNYFAASATLVEAVYQYFSDQLSDNIEKELAKLHQHSILAFYIQSEDSYNSNQINDWIDQYFDGNDDAPEPALFGKLCIGLFNPNDKTQENSTFSILNRLSSILGNFLNI